LGNIIKDRNQWAEVWIRFREGDRKAFSEIYEEFIDVLFAYGSKITNDRELLKDSIQDLFVNLYRYDLNLNHPEYLEFYLFRSLRNEIIRKVRKHKKESVLTDEGLLLFDLRFQAEQESNPESDELRTEALRQVLQTLDDQKRELIFLKFSTGLNNAEIGQLLGLNPETVKKQVYRLLQNLRSKMGNQFFELLMIWCKSHPNSPN
jgi:RNA polymerase sigma-70 factor (ECF subfamily)